MVRFLNEMEQNFVKTRKKKRKIIKRTSERHGRILTQHLWVCPFAAKGNTRTTYWKEKKRESYLSCSIVHSEAIVRLLATNLDLPASFVPTGTVIVIEVVTFSRI